MFDEVSGGAPRLELFGLLRGYVADLSRIVADMVDSAQNKPMNTRQQLSPRNILPRHVGMKSPRSARSRDKARELGSGMGKEGRETWAPKRWELDRWSTLSTQCTC